jgi:NADH-quinone oxidoreductase subunit J
VLVDIFFYLFATALIFSALAVVCVKNPVISVLSLIVSFFTAAALFILLNAEYLAFSLIIVYVGAVAVLFLFVVMFIGLPPQQQVRRGKTKFMWFTLAATILAELCFIFFTRSNCCVHDDLSVFSMSAIKTETNLQAIAQLLYTHYFLAFQLSGIVLLVAMIGSIVLVYEKSTRLKKQNVSAQLLRTKENSLNVIKVLPKSKRDSNDQHNH